MENRGVAYYRVSDPSQLLVVSLTLREVARMGKDSVPSAPLSVRLQVGWQQKLFGPEELARFLKNKDALPASLAERDAMRQLQKLAGEGVDVARLLRPTMVYTHVDGDRFVERVVRVCSSLRPLGSCRACIVGTIGSRPPGR
jgi:hypothetical protein